MGKDKLKKWAENKLFPHVFEPPLLPIIRGEQEFFMKGKWRSDFFRNDFPIVLELGCGKGEYTVELAKRESGKNFIGIDVKGHRFHKGAKEALQEGLNNVAFLRTRIEFISSFFGENEVDELWITFCDPQPQDHEGKRRITSRWYIEKYRTFLKKPSYIFLKHDNESVYRKALSEWPEAGINIGIHSNDVYGNFLSSQSEELKDMLTIRTYYEQMWLDEGRKIKYIEGILR
ncbi:MAG: tRNA (guanosine(46)-N7)-methyltransferase TrmB [Crocinitomicaceae bacterium]|nr:tRNA (guanosine(46)-N7)-methyltransferase TrmB [Crocinitomicaceae bacterium]